MQGVAAITDWSDAEFESIVDLEVGCSIEFDGLYAERTA